MNKQLQELFCNEIDHGRLVFEANSEYLDLLRKSETLFPEGVLPGDVFRLLETANLISFAHGLKLGLRLKRWALR